jgi:hypothetical protein
MSKKSLKNVLSYSFINKNANELLLKTKQDTSKPIDVVLVAKRMGYNTFLTNFDENIRGMVVNDNKEQSIYVNQSDSIEQKRFAIARGISHILLSINENEKYFVDYRNKDKYGKKEYELDSFATALLMPKEFAYKTWQKTQKIKDFAEIMEVSQGVAAIRLTELNLID